MPVLQSQAIVTTANRFSSNTEVQFLCFAFFDHSAVSTQSKAVVLKVDGIAPWGDFKGQEGSKIKGDDRGENNTKWRKC